MPLVHAYRRTKETPIEVNGTTFVFKPNKLGHCVCQVPKGPELDRLLSISEAFRIHGEAAPATEDDEGDGESGSRFIITNGDDTIDLRTLNDEQLFAFAAENDIAVSPKAKGDTIRTKIVEALSGE